MHSCSKLPITTTRIQKITYQLNEFLKSNFKIKLPYEFNESIHHTGHYDQQLQDDVDAWLLTGCISSQKNTYTNEDDPFSIVSVSPTESGMVFAESRSLWLEQALGTKGFRDMGDFVKKFAGLSEEELIIQEKG